MSPIYPYQDKMPMIGEGVFVAPTATVIGDVVIGRHCGIWFNAVLRGDVGSIRIGDRSNVQDLVMIHMSSGISNTEIADDVTIGHSAVLHGCTVGARSLIGMGAILLDNAVIGEECLVAAGALVPTRVVIPPRSLVVGNPAKVARSLTDGELRMITDGVRGYVDLARVYRESGIGAP